MSFEKMRAVGVYPPEPTLNQDTGKVDQAVFVPQTLSKQVPFNLAFGGDAHVSERGAFFSHTSQQMEVPYVVSGINPQVVTNRLRAIFDLQ